MTIRLASKFLPLGKVAGKTHRSTINLFFEDTFFFEAPVPEKVCLGHQSKNKMKIISKAKSLGNFLCCKNDKSW